MAKALRDKILNAKDIKTETVHVDEWDADLNVRGLTGAERMAVIDKATVKEFDEKGKVTDSHVDNNLLLPLLIIATATDPEDGEPLFTDGDVEALNAKLATAIDQVATPILRLSGMAKGQDEELAKNSVATASAASASA